MSNILEISIDDKLTDSMITVELSKELMYKLYRIVEINKYDSMFEYGGYNIFCDAVKDIIHDFSVKINDDYYTLMELVKQDKSEINNVNDAIRCMDSLITQGYEYNDAFNITAEKYFKKGSD